MVSVDCASLNPDVERQVPSHLNCMGVTSLDIAAIDEWRFRLTERRPWRRKLVRYRQQTGNLVRSVVVDRMALCKNWRKAEGVDRIFDTAPVGTWNSYGFVKRSRKGRKCVYTMYRYVGLYFVHDLFIKIDKNKGEL